MSKITDAVTALAQPVAEQLGCEIFTSPLTQYNGALGAALFATVAAKKRAKREVEV